MNLTPKGWKHSEVTENRHRVEIGTRLVYSDACNFKRYTVTSVDGDTATVTDDSDGWEDTITLTALQLGWSFAASQSTN